MRTDTSGIFAYLADALGSTVALADGSGNPTTGYSYAPFGDTSANGLPSANPFQFTGRENDGTGLYYYRARYTDPIRSRFVQEDPLRLAASDVNFYAYIDSFGKLSIVGGNLYEYAEGNPIIRIDPLGLDWIYSQSTGQLYHLNSATDATVYVGTGFAGYGSGLNNPGAQSTPNVGPTPQGAWTIGPQQTNTTSRGRDLPGSMRLYPQPGTNTSGRSGFLIHGGNMSTMSSSRGCIVLPPNVRNQIGNSGDRTLQVVP